MRIAAAQTAPRWGDTSGTTKQVIDWLTKAAAEDVELLAFGETFLSGYPFWVSRTDGARFDAPDQKEAYAYYLNAAVELDGPELTEITEAVADTGVFTYLGVVERSRSGGTVYATLVAIDPAKGVVGAHRKLMPTYDERMVWGQWDGHGLGVHHVGAVRVAGLSCWESWMPVARHVLYSEGLDLLVAVWPGSVQLTRDITRFIALEGRCYVLSAGALLYREAVSPSFPLRDRAFADEDSYLYDGGSAIAAPDGRWLVEPVSTEERLVIGEVDRAAVRSERLTFDPAGHYFRPDVFQVRVDRRRREPTESVDRAVEE